MCSRWEVDGSLVGGRPTGRANSAKDDDKKRAPEGMCGILGIFKEEGVDGTTRTMAYEQSRLQRHRGPDGTGVVVFAKGVMVQERLCLIGVESGRQPLVSLSGDTVVAANCEIYNYKSFIPLIEAHHRKRYVPRSDADVIVELYEMYGEEMVRMLAGMFAFVLYDKKQDLVLVCRDSLGILPLYVGDDGSGGVWVSSEMKCLIGKCSEVSVVEPGHYLYGGIMSLEKKRYFEASWIHSVPTRAVDLDKIRSLLVREVELHLQAETSVGALLSGGLDSSLVAGIASRIMKEGSVAGKLDTYSVGMVGSPDLGYAREVAEYIGSKHHEVTFDLCEGLDCIREVIWFLESYDVTTVRASIPMYILSRSVKKYGTKVILSGEGADEIFGGYLYFHSAPDDGEFHRETVRRTLELSYFDCLRANKSTMAWGVEARVPFLGRAFVEYCMGTDPRDRRSRSRLDSEGSGMEKYVLRKAFSGLGFIPECVIWRQKEQFSDGVGYGWIDGLRLYCESKVTDEEFGKRFSRFEYNTPHTKEGYYYRCVFDEMFGRVGETTVKSWVPRTDWGCSSDPSGRKQRAHVSQQG